MHSYGKKGLKALLQAMKPLSLRAVSLILRNNFTRLLLNQSYEHLGAKYNDAFNICFHNPRLANYFIWNVSFGKKTFKVPVLPSLPRSWDNARVWKWSGNRLIRPFYEWYLDENPTGVYFDIGANDGMHTFAFAVHGYTCVSFEPQPSCIDYIRQVCDLNEFKNVTIMQTAVSNEDGRDVEFYVSESSWYSSFYKDHVEQLEKSTAITAINVNTITVDAFCERKGIRPTFIKIDTEGAEWKVLQGAQNILEQERPDLFIEVDAAEFGKQKIWRMLSGLDYHCYYLPYTFPREAAKLFSPVDSLEAFLATGGTQGNANFIFLANKIRI